MTTTGSASIPAERFVALVGLLNREVRLLERLVFKLTETELLTAAGEARFMGLILDEVHDITADLGGIEVARSMLVADLCDSLGISDEVPLEELAAYAPSDAAPLLMELRERMIVAANDLEAVAATGSHASREQLDRVSTSLAALGPESTGGGGYGSVGGHAALPPTPTSFDQPA